MYALLVKLDCLLRLVLEAIEEQYRYERERAPLPQYDEDPCAEARDQMGGQW